MIRDPNKTRASRRRGPGRPVAVRLFCGLLATDAHALAEAEDALAESFGGVDLASDVMPFTHTDYYANEMGVDLLRRYVLYARTIDPGTLADVKRRTIAIEDRLAAEDGARRVNLDPGYLAPSKFVLASTKNFAHRIYLADGIYAELTLTFRRGEKVTTYPWTYADYRSEAVQDFLLEARRRVLAATGC